MAHPNQEDTAQDPSAGKPSSPTPSRGQRIAMRIGWGLMAAGLLIVAAGAWWLSSG